MPIHQVPVAYGTRKVRVPFAVGEEAKIKFNGKAVIVIGILPFDNYEVPKEFWYIVKYLHGSQATIYIGKDNLVKINKSTFNENHSAN